MKNLTAEQIEKLNSIKETGFLDEQKTKKLVYDLVREKYILFNYINQNDYDTDILNKTESAMKIAKSFASFVPSNAVLNDTKTVKYVFNPRNNDRSYNRGGITHINSFDINKTRLNDTMSEFNKVDYSFFYANFKAYKLLLLNLFSTEERANYFINWLSTIVNTRKKVLTSIIINGVEGSGKGVLKDTIKTIFGDKYVLEAGNEIVSGSFNGELDEKLFVFFEEIIVDYNKNKQIAGKLKRWITDPVLSINAKYGAQFSVENFFNCMFFTNEENPIEIKTGDRRYSIFKSQNKLLDIIDESEFDSYNDFFNCLESEKIDFINFLFRLKYDEKATLRPFDTEEKDGIIQSTSTKIEILNGLLNKGLYNELEYKIEELIELKKQMNQFYPRNYKEILKEIQDDMSKSRIQLKLLPFLYTTLVDENETSVIKIGAKFNNLGEKKSGRGISYRKLNKPYNSVDTSAEFINNKNVVIDEKFNEIIIENSDNVLSKNDVKRVEVFSFSEFVKYAKENEISFLDIEELDNVVSYYDKTTKTNYFLNKELINKDQLSSLSNVLCPF